MTRKKCTSISLAFLMAATMQAKALDYFYVLEQNAGDANTGKPFEPGLPDDFCVRSAVVGTEPLEVVLRSIALWNHITGQVCGAECRNPGKYVAGSLTELPSGDYAFDVQSLCTGAFYQQTLYRKNCPEGMRLSDANLACVPDRTH